MAAFGKASRLPQQISYHQSAIPGAASAGDVTSTDTELESIAFTNTTGAAINIKLMDGNSAVVGNFSGYPIDVGSQPYVLQFSPPLYFTGRMKWLAQSVGLTADVLAWAKANYTT
jgi:hypothetical protein